MKCPVYFTSVWRLWPLIRVLLKFPVLLFCETVFYNINGDLLMSRIFGQKIYFMKKPKEILFELEAFKS